MAWTISGVRVFIQEIDDEQAQTIARLNPIGGGTIYHTYGYDYIIKKINGIVVGIDDRNSLINMARTGESYELAYYPTVISGAGYSWGDYYIKTVNTKMMRSVSQTLRPDLDCDSFVFNVELELYKDE